MFLRSNFKFLITNFKSIPNYKIENLMKIKNYKIENLASSLLLVFLFTIAFLERTSFDLGPNIELITMSMVLVSYYLGKKPAFWLTFAVIALSDRIIGNSNIFIFYLVRFFNPVVVSCKNVSKIRK